MTENPKEFHHLVICRQTKTETLSGDPVTIREQYVACEKEIDEGYVRFRNHILFAARYSDTWECLAAYCRLGSL